MEYCKREFNEKVLFVVKRSGFVLFLVSLMFVFGCGSEQAVSNSNSNSRNSNSPTSNQVSTTGNSPVAPPPVEGNSNQLSPLQRKLQQIEQMRAEAAKSGDSKPPTPDIRPAPENSEIYIELRDNAREVRTFKSHPTLKQVIKVTDTNGTAITVFYRDGRRFDFPGNAIADLGTVSTADLMRMTDPALNKTTKE